MNKNLAALKMLVPGFYAWMAAVFFGAILLDVAYANRLNGVFKAAETQGVFAKVSDLLLLLGFVTILAAILAIAFSWRARTSRYLLIASLLAVLLEFLIPFILSPFVQAVEHLGIGPWLRLFPSGLGSILAIGGLIYAPRQE